MAKSISWCASAPMVAPTSSTTLSPRSVGQIAAIAGRSMLAMVRRQNFDIAISAPVLPAETQTSASPVLTASTAFHIDDFQRPWRSAWLGLSSMRTAMSQCTKVDAAATFGNEASTGAHLVLAAEDQEAHVRPALDHLVQGRKHHLRPVIAAHGVNGNPYHAGVVSLFPGRAGFAEAGRK